ncbi:MAG: c-type cytochrome [Acidobacteriota bacterium]
MSRRITMMATMVAGFALMMFVVMSIDTMAQGKDPNERGRKLYVQYCASCHGMDAKGNGPVANALRTPPNDLTILAQRHGHFDRLRVENSIQGEVSVPAHGTSEMPVWGAYFRRQQGSSMSTLNIYALMNYLEAIQVK